jgi:hypothetical protein
MYTSYISMGVYIVLMYTIGLYYTSIKDTCTGVSNFLGVWYIYTYGNILILYIVSV